MAVALDILLNLKSMIFVDEILTKTRSGGLNWIPVNSSTYTCVICQPSPCPYVDNTSMSFSASSASGPAPSTQWTLTITQNSINTDPNLYAYYLEVQIDGLPFMTIPYRPGIDNVPLASVSALYEHIKITQIPLGSRPVRRAIKFMSNIPTSPSSSVYNLVMCGGIEGGGEDITSAHYYPLASHQGAEGGGSAVVYVTHPALLRITGSSRISASGTVSG